MVDSVIIEKLEKLTSNTLSQRETTHCDEMIEYIDRLLSGAISLEGEEKLKFLTRNLLVMREHFVIKKNSSQVLSNLIKLMLQTEQPQQDVDDQV